MVEGGRKDNWDKAIIFFEILKIVCIVAGILVINTTLKTNELKIEYVKIAVDILKAKPDSESKELRLWAVEVLDSKSDIPLSKEAVKTLLQKELPTQKLSFDNLTEEEFDKLSEEEFNNLRIGD